MQLRLYTLSPLHIGTGENLAPLDYVAHKEVFYRIDQEELIKLVRAQFPDGAKRFSDWISAQYAAMRDLRDNREQSQLANRINAHAFFKAQGQERAFLQYLSGSTGSRVIYDDDIRERQRGQDVVALGQVREAARSAGKPYLPGSSIKGALRTALLYAYLTDHADAERVRKLVDMRLQDRRSCKENFAKPLEEEVFFCDYFDGTKGRNRSGEAQMDLMRAVSVSDAALQGEDSRLAVAKINIYLVEKRRHPNRRDEVTMASGRQRQASYAEVIPAGRELTATLTVDGAFLYRLAHWAQGDKGLARGHDKYWIGLDTRISKLFGMSLSEMRQSTPEAIAARVEQYMVNCLDRFARRQLDRQNIWTEHYVKHDERDRYASRIKRGFNPLRAAGETPFLHLGYGAGFTATTALLYFLEDQKREKLAKAILEQFGIGRAPNQKGPYTANLARFPKSRRLVETQGSIQPLGWLALLAPGQTGPAVEDSGARAAYAVKEELAPEKSNIPPAPPKPTGPTYFTGKPNPKKTVELDAEVLASGTPNQVKVYLYPDNCPTLPLQAYRTPLPQGAMLVVLGQFNGKGELMGVSFKKMR